MAVTLSYRTSASSTSDLSSYSFGSLDFGTEDSSRIMVVAVHAVTGSSPNTLCSAVDIGGVSATQVTTAAIVQGVALVEFWYAAVPTGTTGQTVDVTCGEAQVRCAIGLWSLIGSDTSPSDSDETSSASANSIALSTVTIPTDGCGIFAATSSTGVYTWTNASERYDAAWAEGGQHTGADTTTAGTPTVTADGPNAAIYAFAGIAFGPAPAGGGAHQFLTILGVS
jgi:hypothetical protein